jgi:peptidoglycan/LPS O-acetylase OafA/YrhL
MVAHYLSTTRGPDWLKAFIDHGYIPVDIFMILSGFVLAMTYQGYFRDAVAAGGVGRFLAYRLARIYPLHLVTSLLCVAQILAHMDVWGNNGITGPSMVANLLLVQAWASDGHTLNAPAWSISTEWAANLLFPVLVVVLLRWSWRRSAACAAAAFAVLVVWALLFGQLGENDPWRGAVNWYAGPEAVMRCVVEFILGMVCWRLHAAGWSARLGTTPVLVATIAAMLGITIWSWLDLPLIALACVLILGLAAERSTVAAALGSAVPRWLGVVSFSVYLWQIPLLPLRPLMIDAASGLGAADPWLAGNLATMGLVLLVSGGSYRWLEIPSQRAVRAAYDRRFPRLSRA